MHKYWGKKPSNDLNELIGKYSNPGDILLDPFSGYGVFCCEAYIMQRNVISNDLNPVAHFLNCQLLEKDLDLEKIKFEWRNIKSEFQLFINSWYGVILNNINVELITILRDKADKPIKAKFKIEAKRNPEELIFSSKEIDDYLMFEKSQEITDWYPKIKLISNSRISAKPNMQVEDLFTKRTLACHSRLFSLINKYSSGNELKLFKVAFTANLANCSKLVPPIKSRGDISQGAWMTGFYVGETYIENNVLHYFENRLKKVIKGKEDYFSQFNKKYGSIKDVRAKDESDDFNNKTFGYLTLMNDAKCLQLKDNSVDYVFTDPPYGEAVPYFEQSVIWNAWLEFSPNYECEIVISDSKERNKNHEIFENEINKAFSEIARVLKPNKYFSLTYHSLSGKEWKAITNACIRNGFELRDFKWLVQKSFTPRQINNNKSIKGDVLITLKKSFKPTNIEHIDDEILEKEIIELIKKDLKNLTLETNDIFLLVMKMLFSKQTLVNNLDLLQILKNNFGFINGKWKIK